MSAAPLRLEVQGGRESLERLREPWAELCDRCPHTTVFQRPEWLLPWMEHFGPRDPWIGAARAGDRLLALAPLFVYGIDEREVALLGAGLSDYLDVLCDPGLEEATGRAALAMLAECAGAWTRCHLDDLRRESPLCRGAAPGGWRDRIERDGGWWVLALGRIGGEDFAWLRPGRRKKLRAALRRAGREGELHFERAAARSWLDRWPELERLHTARWRSRGEPGMLADAARQRFHREVAAGFARRDELSLYTLALDGQIVAALYGLEERDTLYYYLSGFDPALSELSVGNLVVGLAAEDARRRGLAYFDFLRGGESYKAAWGAAEVPRYRRVLERAAASLSDASARARAAQGPQP